MFVEYDHDSDTAPLSRWRNSVSYYCVLEFCNLSMDLDWESRRKGQISWCLLSMITTTTLPHCIVIPMIKLCVIGVSLSICNLSVDLDPPPLPQRHDVTAEGNFPWHWLTDGSMWLLCINCVSVFHVTVYVCARRPDSIGRFSHLSKHPKPCKSIHSNAVSLETPQSCYMHSVVSINIDGTVHTSSIIIFTKPLILCVMVYQRTYM